MAQKTYTGGCQCGAVRFEVNVDLDSVMTCDCSRCQKLGSVLSFAPRDQFTLLSGDGATTEYLFNNKVIQHLFCATCGIESFAFGQMPDGSKVAAINANCLDGVDPRALSPKHVHGAEF